MTIRTAVWVCSRCKGREFSVFAGPSGKTSRCTNCAFRKDLATCECGHGGLAHVRAGGCEGATDDGGHCACQERCPA